MSPYPSANTIDLSPTNRLGSAELTASSNAAYDDQTDQHRWHQHVLVTCQLATQRRLTIHRGALSLSSFLSWWAHITVGVFSIYIYIYILYISKNLMKYSAIYNELYFSVTTSCSQSYPAIGLSLHRSTSIRLERSSRRVCATFNGACLSAIAFLSRSMDRSKSSISLFIWRQWDDLWHI